MKIFRYQKRNTPPYLLEFSPSFDDFSKSGCVLALGFFDGVHLGHRALINRAKSEARELGIPFGIFTFPSENKLKSAAPRLTTTDEKCEIFESLGADFTILADFDSMVDLSAEDFVSNVLIKDVGAKSAVAGYNFRFGKGALGNVALLLSEMEKHGARGIAIDEFSLASGSVSASAVRALLQEGKPREAAALLGQPYFLSGVVEHGNGVGRGLGYPTVNTPIPGGKALPRPGVYRSAIRMGDQLLTALTNVGVCPTLGERSIHAETFILNFKGDIYGKAVTVFLLDYLREEMRFSDVSNLITQIDRDVENITKNFGDVTWQEIGLS